MENEQTVKPVKPRGVRIEVTRNGMTTANVRVPYFFVKMGLKFGQTAEASKEGGCAEELERLREVDMDSIFGALDSGDLTLPYPLAEVDEPEKNQHVKITLE